MTNEHSRTKSTAARRTGSRRRAVRDASRNSAETAWRPVTASEGTGASAGVALWRQIAEDIESDIETGRFSAGTQLPTEAALAARFGVNRHTLRRAIGELTKKGLVEATPGRGTFVRTARLAYPIGQTTRFSEAIAEKGREPTGQHLRHATVTVPPGIAGLLNLAVDAKVVELEHLRGAGELPICLATTWFPASRFEGIGEAYAKFRTITKSLAKFGAKEYRRHRTLISCRTANSREREFLQLERGANVLVIDSVNVDADGVPIQASHSRFAADRVQLEVET